LEAMESVSGHRQKVFWGRKHHVDTWTYRFDRNDAL